MKLGIDKFRELIEAERATLAEDPRWTSYLSAIDHAAEPPAQASAPLVQLGAPSEPEFADWSETNVYAQRRAGYSAVTITLPLGDITADQLRSLADIARRYTPGALRTTVDQNIILRSVANADVASVHSELRAAGLGAPGANTIADPTSCPGTDTCKLGISSSRGLAAELRTRLAENGAAKDDALRDLRIKISGCFNSCGQHHIADLGFYGVSRNKNGYAAPHFQVVLGGEWGNNAGSYGLAIGAVPSKRVPDAVERITTRYRSEREPRESFQSYVRRIGKAECKKMLEDLTALPLHDEDSSYYRDWRDVREYSLGDIGIGECAGAIVSPLEFQLTACERETFEAQLALDALDAEKAARLAYEAMSHGAAALLGWRQIFHDKTPDGIAEVFRRDFYDTQLFFDPFAGGKFAQYYFAAHAEREEPATLDGARRRIEEAQLFVEACHACVVRESAAAAVRS